MFATVMTIFKFTQTDQNDTKSVVFENDDSTLENFRRLVGEYNKEAKQNNPTQISYVQQLANSKREKTIRDLQYKQVGERRKLEQKHTDEMKYLEANFDTNPGVLSALVRRRLDCKYTKPALEQVKRDLMLRQKEEQQQLLEEQKKDMEALKDGREIPEKRLPSLDNYVRVLKQKYQKCLASDEYEVALKVLQTRKEPELTILKYDLDQWKLNSDLKLD